MVSEYEVKFSWLLNPYLSLPYDLVVPWAYAFAFGAAHFLLVRYILRPLSIVLVSADEVKPKSGPAAKKRNKDKGAVSQSTHSSANATREKVYTIPRVWLTECQDPFMEVAKACLYAKAQFFADLFVTIFAITFFVTRLYIYPVYVISSLLLYAHWPDGSVLPNYDFNRAMLAALSILLMLHIYWGFLILQVVYKAIMSGGAQGDVRDRDED
ncbi:MAG: hypothetical protein SGCHY_002833 [Lobulomycetales sp.]